MVRIYKHYDFALSDSAVRARRMSFASYPGELSSDDDFYLMNSGLAVLQTTNNILNTSLYDALTPQSVVNWQRVRYALARPYSWMCLSLFAEYELCWTSAYFTYFTDIWHFTGDVGGNHKLT